MRDPLHPSGFERLLGLGYTRYLTRHIQSSTREGCMYSKLMGADEERGWGLHFCVLRPPFCILHPALGQQRKRAQVFREYMPTYLPACLAAHQVRPTR